VMSPAEMNKLSFSDLEGQCERYDSRATSGFSNISPRVEGSMDRSK